MTFIYTLLAQLSVLGITLAAIFSLTTPVFAATEYYVATAGSDGNPGTQSAPFQSIVKASAVAKAGDTVHVQAGVYPGQILTTSNGTASAHIRFLSDIRGSARVTGLQTGSEILWSVRGNYVDIEGFEIDGTNSTVLTLGIGLFGSNDTAKNNIVHDIATTLACSNHGAAGIQTDSAFGGSNETVEANIVLGIGTFACQFHQGIALATSGMIINNLVFGAANTGILSTVGGSSVNILNNTIFGNARGIIVGGDRTNVANNIAFDNSSVGIGEVATAGSRNLFSNNLSFGSATNWGLGGSRHTSDVSADPQFINYIRAGGGDYHLMSTSPAINTGTLSIGGVNAPSTDIEGNSRPVGVANDIGAYEYGSVSGGGGTPAPTSGPCLHAYTNAVSVPTGYGAAFNTFSMTKELTVQGDCVPNIPVLKVGSGLSTQYVYKIGYAYKGGAWQQINLTSAGALISDNWYAGAAQGNLPFTDNDFNTWNYIVGYICAWDGSAWKCGCADSACGSSSWQLQAIRR